MRRDGISHLAESAVTRFKTIDATWSFRCDSDLLAKAADRRSYSQAGISDRPLEPERGRSQPAVACLSQTGHLWWHKPDRWRDESCIEGRASAVRVIRGDRYSAFVPDMQMLFVKRMQTPTEQNNSHAETWSAHLAEFPIVDPAFFVHACEITSVHQTSYLASPAFDVTLQTKPSHFAVARPFFWAGVQDYAMTVDAERGVLLRLRAFVDGRTASDLKVTAISFDQDLRDDLFTYTPPNGTRIIDES